MINKNVKRLVDSGNFKADIYNSCEGISFRVFVENNVIVKAVALDDGNKHKGFDVIMDRTTLDEIFYRGDEVENIQYDEVIDPDKCPDSVFVECDRRAMAKNILMLKEEKQKTFWSAWPNGNGWQLVGEPFSGCTHQFLHEMGLEFTGGQHVIK